MINAHVAHDKLANGQTPPNGGKFSQAAAGPIVDYFLPQYNMILEAKYTVTYYHRNILVEQLLVLSAGIKF